MNRIGHSLGFPPAGLLYNKREFKAVAINPPNFKPGSWCGASKIIFDVERNEYLLTSRPRVSEDNKRGIAAEIYGSPDGIADFKLITAISKEKCMDLSGKEVKSIEGTQLLGDPLTMRWYFYISIDNGLPFPFQSSSNSIWGLNLPFSKTCKKIKNFSRRFFPNEQTVYC